MAGTPATVALTAAGIVFAEHEYVHDPANTNFGLEAADALGIEAERVFKTLLADVSLDDGRSELVVGIVPVTGMLDLKHLAAAVGGKRAEMADPEGRRAAHRLRGGRDQPDRAEDAAPHRAG